MYKTVATNIIERFDYWNDNLILLTDDTFLEIAECMQREHGNTQIIAFETFTPDQIRSMFQLPSSSKALLLADPHTYLKHKLPHLLDFEHGEPRIPHMNSRVMIFPLENLCRIFTESLSADNKNKESIVERMKENRQYRVIAPGGTDLTFQARRWIPLDFEVCTAPVENSINGTIVVDGAFFFQKIDEKIVFHIKNGKIQDITAATPPAEELLLKYRNMTKGAMQDPINTQLAEIGIGFCNGAWITDCFMESEAAADTCHFCFGNNVFYGGSNASDFHGASVLIKKPQFILCE